jgi:hypothetical protein
MKLICLMIASDLICGAQGEMPLSFTEAVNNDGQKDILSVKNYDAGASFAEEYTDIEHLERNTEINSRTISSAGSLEASINSNVIGKARIAWQSTDPGVSIKGRHPLLGRSVEDLTGVFSIEKFIILWSGSRPGEISVDWLPCS